MHENDLTNLGQSLDNILDVVEGYANNYRTNISKNLRLCVEPFANAKVDFRLG